MLIINPQVLNMPGKSVHNRRFINIQFGGCEHPEQSSILG
jgi:hypothetical protein